MRDWNFFCFSSRIFSIGNFQPTYEGLKPPIYKISQFKFIKNFQPTYEGLKPCLVHLYLFPNPNFQPTYEGLKLSLAGNNWFNSSLFSAYLWGIETKQYQLGKQLKKIIFSLPMRDWNTVFWLHHRIGDVIFSLPMRDWNSKKVSKWPPVLKTFSAYLWGIETLILQDQFFCLL